MQEPNINLYHQDCMEAMRSMPDNAYDLAIVDPPYGIGAGKMTMGSGKHKFSKNKDWDKNTPEENYFIELFRVSKDQIIFGGNYFNLPTSNDWIIWDKLNPNLSFSEAEMAWCSIKKNIRIFKHYSAMVEAGGKIHPTEKPKQLYKWILTKYANGGAKILDTHGGSRSLAIACYDLGFDHDSYEIDADYHNESKLRFDRHKFSTIKFPNPV